ncbi:TetR/AcrR family transcriptional regulator [bacterium]|nr:TetR/AcrR family transcriptional regulator [bacterium]
MAKNNPHRKEEILEAALRVFGEKGFLGSTNRDIAQAAGMRSAALIYHYFESREDLLRRVIERYHPVIQFVQENENGIPADLTSALTDFAEQFAKLLDQPKTLAAMRILISEALHDANMAAIIYDLAPSRVLAMLEKCFAQHIAAGELKQQDARKLTLEFLGPLMLIISMKSIFGKSLCSVCPSAYVRDFIASKGGEQNA